VTEPRLAPTTRTTESSNGPMGTLDRLESCRSRAALAAQPEPLYGELLDALVGAAQATRASLMLVNPATGRLRIVAAIGLPPDVVGRDVTPRPRSISEWVFRHRRGLILNGEVHDQRFEGVAGKEVESALSLPLLGSNGALGVLNCARRTPAPVFSPDEQGTLERTMVPAAEILEQLENLRFSTRAGRAIRGARLRTLIGRGPSETRNYQMATAHRPSGNRGADFCERVAHAGTGYSVAVVDVTGDGPGAQALAALVQGLFVASAAPERALAAQIGRLNADLNCRLHPGEFAALWAAQLSLNGQLISCTAGFPAPLWIPADGSDPTWLTSGGPVVGALPFATYDTETIRLLPGDTIVAVSDGVIQACDAADQMFGSARVSEWLSENRRLPVERLVEQMIAAVVEFTGRPVPADDLTAFALRFTRD